MLRNLSIRTKLLFAFVSVALLCCVVGAFAWSGLSSIKASITSVHADRVVPMAQLREVADGYMEQIVMSGHKLTGGRMTIPQAQESVAEGKRMIEENWNAYVLTYLTEEEKGLVAEAKKARAIADASVARYESALAKADMAAISECVEQDLMDNVLPITHWTDELGNLQLRVASEEVHKAEATVEQNVFWMVLITVGAMSAALGFGFLLSKLIVTPLNSVRDAARRIAVGDVDQQITHRSGDELGQLADAARDMIAYNKAVAMAVQNVGAGDLSQPLTQRSPQDLVARSINDVRDRLQSLIQATGKLAQSAASGNLQQRGDESSFQGAFRQMLQEVNGLVDSVAKPMTEVNEALVQLAARDLTTRMTGSYRGEFAAMQKAFNAAAVALAETLTEVRLASEQVAAAAGEIQQTSKQLATGASEQASALEEVSASLQESVSGAKRSATNTNEATSLAQDAQNSVRGGTDGMTKMSGAMDRIKSTTDQTARILRTIDEIAFQTNLLALNAAVEAARAGDAGRGFAVVADEVRNLAIRSADAAKQTAALIEQSLSSAEEGVTLNASVVATFGQIDQKVKRVGSVVGDIAQAAEGQSRGAQQIGIGVEEVSKVTQQNAAAAEEAAAAAQELASQAGTLERLVSQFRLDEATSHKTRARKAAARAHELDEAMAGVGDEEMAQF